MEERANLSGGEFNALVIKMLTDLIELGQKMKKANEGYPIFILFHEIKQNTQGTDSDRKETKIQSNHLEQKEKNKHPTRMK